MIECRICGKKYKRVCSHVRQSHGISAREYKQEYGLDVKKGLLSEDDREIMRQHTLSNGTIKNLQKGKKSRFKKNHKQTYIRSEQTKERLRKNWDKIANRSGRPPIRKPKINCALCGKEKEIYPRHYKENNNYCGITCRNRSNNMKTYTENKKVIEKLESDLNINIEIDASRCDIDITTSKLRQRLESGNIDSFGAVTITPAQ